MRSLRTHQQRAVTLCGKAASAPISMIVYNAANAILGEARKNKAITSTGLREELAAGEIMGWAHLLAIKHCNFSDWSAAMSMAADRLESAGR